MEIIISGKKLELENIKDNISKMKNKELYMLLTITSYIYNMASVERDNRLIGGKNELMGTPKNRKL